MIDKLLITCLQRGKRLIIPDLGAFLKKEVEGVGTTLVFVPFLNKDDGTLVSAVQKWGGVDEEDAKEIVSQYVKHIKSSLDLRGQYIIEGLGVLKFDANGVIYLTKGGTSTAQGQHPAAQEKPASPPVFTANERPVPVEPATPSVADNSGSRNDGPSFEIPRAEEQTAEPKEKEHPFSVTGREEAKEEDIETAASSTDRFPETTEEKTTGHESTGQESPVDTVRPPQDRQQQFQQPQVQNTQSRYSPGGREVGTRYFSPEHVTEQDASKPAETNAQHPNEARKNTINHLYGRNSGAIYGSTAVDQSGDNAPKTIGSTLGSGKTMADKLAASRPAQQKSAVQTPAAQRQHTTAETDEIQAQGNISRPYTQTSRQRSPYGPAPKKRSRGDLFLIIAVAAAIIAIAVMIYGYFFGSEAEIDLRTETKTEQAQSVPDSNNQPETPEIGN